MAIRQENPNALGRIVNFSPTGNGICIGASTLSGNAPFPTLLPTQLGNDVLVVSDPSNTVNVFVAFGGSSIAAVAPVSGTPANGILIGPGVVVSLDKSQATYAAAITSSGTANIYFYQGAGS
jgi:hypothetical protein